MSSVIDDLLPKINYSFSSLLLPNDPIQYIKIITSEIYVHNDDLEDYELAGKCEFLYVDLLSSDMHVAELLDQYGGLDIFYSLYDEASGFNLREDLLDEMGEQPTSPNLFIINNIQILPKFRKKRLSIVAINDAVHHFCHPSWELIVLKPFPLQFSESEIDKLSGFKKLMQYHDLPREENTSLEKLKRFYKANGFIEFEEFLVFQPFT